MNYTFILNVIVGLYQSLYLSVKCIYEDIKQILSKK